jgi:hypothetical protein
MSVVTNVLVLTSLLEELDETETYPAVDELNRMLTGYCTNGFREVGQGAGGNKVMERCVFAAAFNCLIEEDLLLYLRQVPWADKDCVQVLVSRHEQEGFSLIYGLSTAEAKL